MDGKARIRHTTLDRHSYGAAIVDNEPLYVTTPAPGVLHVAREHRRVQCPLAQIKFNPTTWTVTGITWKSGWGRLDEEWKDRAVDAVMRLVQARTKVCSG